MKEKDVKLELVFDKSINLFSAFYKDNAGKIVENFVSMGPSKTFALKWLAEEGPDINLLFPKKKQQME